MFHPGERMSNGSATREPLYVTAPAVLVAQHRIFRICRPDEPCETDSIQVLDCDPASPSSARSDFVCHI